MIVTKVLEGYFEVLKNTLADYALLEHVVHDPDMGYSYPMREVVLKDLGFQTTGRKDWLVLSWAREMLKPTEEQERLFTFSKRIGNMPEGYEFRVRYVDLTLQLQFLSPSEQTIEAVEETFLCFPPLGPFDYYVDKFDEGPFSASVKHWSVTGLSRVSTETLGSLMSLQATSVVGCIVPLLKRRAKLVAKVIPGIKVVSTGDIKKVRDSGCS